MLLTLIFWVKYLYFEGLKYCAVVFLCVKFLCFVWLSIVRFSLFSLFHFFVQFMWFPWILVVFLGEICIISRVPYSCFCEKYMSNVWLLMYFSWNSCTSVFFVNFLLLFFVATHVFLWNSSGLCAYLFFSHFLCDYWC